MFGCCVDEYPGGFFEAGGAGDEEEGFVCFGGGGVAFFEVDAGDAGEVDAAEEVYVDCFVGWFLFALVSVSKLLDMEV